MPCRKEQRNLEKQIRDNSRLEKVAQKQIREAAKRNDMASAKTLAKELVHTRRMTTRLWTNKAHMMSMSSQLTEQLGMVKVAGTLKQSTQVHLVQTLMNATRFLLRVMQILTLQVNVNLVLLRTCLRSIVVTPWISLASSTISTVQIVHCVVFAFAAGTLRLTPAS